MHGRFRWVGALLLAQAALAVEIDPYYFHRAAGVLELPSRGTLYAVLTLQVATGLALLFAVGRSGGILAWWGCIPALLSFVVSCPFNAALVHTVQATLLLLILGVLLAAAGHESASLSRASIPRRLPGRLALVVLVLLLVEGAFSVVPRCHAVGYTLAARLWFKRYWFDVHNRFGYRDLEHADDGRPHLLIVGDSFVSGVGIRDANDRFSDLLRTKVSERYQVHNLGWNGSDSVTQMERLNAYPFKADVVVLTWFVNDIVAAAAESGKRPPSFRPYQYVPPVLRALIVRSYFLDFLYWQLPHDDLRAAAQFIERCFQSPEIIERQQSQLEALIACAKQQGALVLAVAFPDLGAPPLTASWVEPALEVFRCACVPAVDVRNLIQDLALAEITVNRNDSHPNELVHARVAEALFELLQNVDPRLR